MTEQQIKAFIEVDDALHVEEITPCNHGYLCVMDGVKNYFIERNPLELTVKEFLDMGDGVITFVGPKDWVPVIEKLEKISAVNLTTPDFQLFWQGSQHGWKEWKH